MSSEARGYRIKWDTVDYESEPEEPEPKQEDYENEDDYWDQYDAWQATQKIQQPEPRAFERFKRSQATSTKIDIRELFEETGLQVIVKLANIELTPENPEYDGGSWHVEGQLVSHCYCNETQAILDFFIFF